MYLICERNLLLNALTELQTVVQSRVVSPALSCVYLQASSNELVLTGTNTGLTLYLTISCTVQQPGTVLVQQRLFTEWLKNTPGETVELKLKDNKLTVIVSAAKSVKAKCTLATFPGADFPHDNYVADALANTVAIELPNEIERALRLTAVATLDNAADPRAHLHALTFVFTPTKLTIYATDSYRLALQELAIATELNTTFMLLVQGVQTNLLSLLKQIQPHTSIGFYDLTNQVVFAIQCKNYQAILSIRKVVGLPINITGLIPKETEVNLTLNRLELITAVQGAQVFGRDNHNRVYLTIDAENNTLTISSQYTQAGAHENDMAISQVTGVTKMQLILNALYLLEYLKATDAQELNLSRRANERAPIILRDTTQPEQGLYLMMPIYENSN